MSISNMKAKVKDRNVKATLTLEFTKTYDDNTEDSVKFTEGDLATIQWVDPKDYSTVTAYGVIKSIITTDRVSNALDKIFIVLDASEEGKANVINIPMLNIVDIILDQSLIKADNVTTVEPNRTGAIPNLSPISWNMNKIAVKDHLLEIPYARLAAGTVQLEIIDNSNGGKLVFKEKFEAKQPNNDASFTWSLRDFSAVASIAEDNDELLVEDGFYVYRNGDSDNEIILATDNNNDLIIPVGSVLLIQIKYFDSIKDDIDAPTVTISKLYTVTAEDINDVTSTVATE